MKELEILIYPDKKLKQKSEDVTEITEEIKELLENMEYTMEKLYGVGIAAIQVGIPKNMIIVKDLIKQTNIKMINPKILSSEGEQTFKEGCLSVPGFLESVKRKKSIEVEYMNIEGKIERKIYTEMTATIIQHEIEHTQGSIFINNLNIIKRKKFEKTYKKLLKK